MKRLLCLGVLLVGLLSAAAWAGGVPTGDVVLTISGPLFLSNRYDDTRGAAVFEFDMDMLKELPVTTYTVTDPWLGEKTYTGVTLADLLGWVGVDYYATKVTVIASDGMSAPVDTKDAATWPIMIAYASNNKAIKASSGGPLKLVFPYQIAGVEDKYIPDSWMWFVVELSVGY